MTGWRSLDGLGGIVAADLERRANDGEIERIHHACSKGFPSQVRRRWLRRGPRRQRARTHTRRLCARATTLNYSPAQLRRLGARQLSSPTSASAMDSTASHSAAGFVLMQSFVGTAGAFD